MVDFYACYNSTIVDIWRGTHFCAHHSQMHCALTTVSIDLIVQAAGGCWLLPLFAAGACAAVAAGIPGTERLSSALFWRVADTGRVGISP